jgi:hypothetical protein
MGNGLETLSYSPSKMDKLLVNVDENIEWLNKSEFIETRKIINLLKKIVQEKRETGSIPYKYNNWSDYLLQSLDQSLEKNLEEINLNKDDNSKNIIEKNLEERLEKEGFNLGNNEDTSLNNGLTWMSNNGKPYKRKNTNN